MTDPSAISIFQDSRGFMWVGSWGGLFRYDGYQFKHYPSIAYDSSSISGQGVLAIVEDKFQRLWVACNNGLNVYDREHDRFFRIRHDRMDTTSISGDDINCMMLDSKNRLWIGTYHYGLCYAEVDKFNHLTEQSPVFRRFTKHRGSANNLSSDFIHSVFEDSEGTIWITTGDGVLHRWKENTDFFEQYKFPDEIVKRAGYIELWMEDKEQQSLWFTTRGAGIFSWNKKSKKIKRYARNFANSYLSFDIARHLWRSPDGVLWVGTDGGGLSLIDDKKGEIANYRYQAGNPFSISSDAIYRIFQDHSKNIWLATFNGQLSKFNAYRTAFKLYQSKKGFSDDGLNHKSVLSLIEDKQGNLWIGTDGGGVNILNIEKGTFSYLTSENKGLTANAIICMTQDKEGEIWMGTYGGGLMCYHPSTGKIDKFIYEPNDSNTIRENNIWTITTDRNQNIWCVTLSGILELYNPVTKRFIHFDSDPLIPHNYLIAYPTQMLVDSRNWLWITTTQGIIKLDLNRYDFTKQKKRVIFDIYQHIEGKSNTPPTNEIYAMAEDANGNMWFGTNEGWLFMLDVNAMKFGATIVHPELNSHGIRSMVFDKQNRLWMGTTNGLWQYIPKDHSFIRYDESDGLQGNIFSRAIVLLHDGKIAAGGTNGFNLFNPVQVPVNHHPPQVVITQFKLFGQPVKVGEPWKGRIILSKAIEETHEIFLPYSLNYFSFEFSALDFTNPSKNRYAYILEGLDKDWQYTAADRREAIYANLGPGDYVFKVKATNNDGIWSTQPAVINIHIVPPWWNRWWIKLLLSIFLLGLLVLYIYRKSVLAELREKELNALVIQRTQELLEKNNILLQQQEQLSKQAEDLRKYSETLAEINKQLLEKQQIIMEQSAQLEQSNEQLKMLNASKDKFFSIIAHDLRNPFNVLIGLSEIMYRNYDTLPPEKIKRYAEIISLSAKSGYNLLENLLQWSRAQTGSISFTPAKTQLISMIEETFDLLQADAERKGIILNHTVDPNIVVWADESMLLTVLRNLVSNAIKFTPEKGRVEVGAKVLDDKTVLVSVSDTGIGIGADVIPKLFRIDVTYTTKGTANESGTGLGLILCKEFIEKHKGQIWVESKEKEGTTFYFTLPSSPV